MNHLITKVKVLFQSLINNELNLEHLIVCLTSTLHAIVRL